VIDALLFSYLDEQRLPSHTFYVLDVSGSMEGEGLRDLKAALTNLTGLDPSLTGQFARFRSREQVTMLPFSSEVEDVRSFAVDATAAAGQDMERIRGYVDQLQADGNTAIYSALADAYSLAQQAQVQDPDRAYSIVLMSDGQNNSGISPQDFRSAFQDLPPQTQQVKTFTVLFGDADRKEMEQIAELTGGRMFDATSESLSRIFKEIRGYQ
jgi:Ca-activated chloride channel family protein